MAHVGAVLCTMCCVPSGMTITMSGGLTRWEALLLLGLLIDWSAKGCCCCWWWWGPVGRT